MEWIKLTDQLPPYDTLIVMLSANGHTQTMMRRSPEYIEKFRKAARTTIFDENGFRKPLSPSINGWWTHWLLLPELPTYEDTDK